MLVAIFAPLLWAEMSRARRDLIQIQMNWRPRARAMRQMLAGRLVGSLAGWPCRAGGRSGGVKSLDGSLAGEPGARCSRERHACTSSSSGGNSSERERESELERMESLSGGQACLLVRSLGRPRSHNNKCFIEDTLMAAAANERVRAQRPLHGRRSDSRPPAAAVAASAIICLISVRRICRFG